MRKSKKGFTLVELLVVIAILAILATVTVIGYSSFTEKAKQSNDENLITQLNTVLQGEEASGNKAETFGQVVDMLLENGYYIENLTPTSSKNDFVWDSVNNKFVIVKQGELLGSPVAKSTTWVVVDTETRLEELKNTFAIYLTSDFVESGDGVITAVNSLDASDFGTELTINYENNSAKKTVVFGTNGGTLNINAANDTVTHYGTAKVVDITAVAEHSYHEKGQVLESLKIKAGRVVVEEKAEVAKVVVNATTPAEIRNIKVEVVEKAPEKQPVFEVPRKAGTNLSQEVLDALKESLPIEEESELSYDDYIEIKDFDELYAAIAYYEIYDVATKTVSEHNTQPGTYKLMDTIYMDKIVVINNHVKINMNGNTIEMTKPKIENDLRTWANEAGVCFFISDMDVYRESSSLHFYGTGTIKHDELYKEKNMDIITIDNFCDAVIREMKFNNIGELDEHWGYSIKTELKPGQRFTSSEYPQSELFAFYDNQYFNGRRMFAFYALIDMVTLEPQYWTEVVTYEGIMLNFYEDEETIKAITVESGVTVIE